MRRSNERAALLEARGGKVGRNGVAATVLATFKSVVGPAILYLPKGVANAGVLGSLLCLFLAFSTFVFGINQLLGVWNASQPPRGEHEEEQLLAGAAGGGEGVRSPVHAGATEGAGPPAAGTPGGADARPRPAPLRADDGDEEATPHILELYAAPESPSAAARGGAARASRLDLLVEKLARGGGYIRLAHESLGSCGVLAVVFCSTVLQCGCCLTYYIFVAENGAQLFLHFFGFAPSLGALVGGHCLLQVLLSLPRRIEAYKLTNLLGNACIIFTLFVIFGVAAQGLIEDGVSPSVAAFEADTLYLFVGMSMFVFEGASPLTIPLQEAAAPHVRQRFRSVYVGTMAGIMLLFLAFALVNYLHYGAEISVIVTLDLPSATWPGQVVRLLYCVAVLFTFPLMLFPVTKMLVLAAGFDDTKRLGRLQNDLLRALLVGLLALVAVAEAGALDHIVALLGCVASTPLALILPPLMHLRAVPQTPISAAVNKAVAAFGCAVTVVTTATTLATWGSASS